LEQNTPANFSAKIQEDGDALQHVPEALKTSELCLAAVQKYGMALEHVPESRKSPELCLAAVQNNSEALDYVPETLKAEIRARSKSV
jgi:hypothetical protein